MTIYSEKRARESAETARVLAEMHPIERALHVEVNAARGWLRAELIPAGELGREVFVTPFPGAYGVAGYVVTLDGSPPRFLAVVEGKDERYADYPIIHVIVPHGIRPIDGSPNRKWAPLRAAVLAFIKWRQAGSPGCAS